MKYEFFEISKNIKCCLVYIDNLSNSIKKLIDEFFLEIIIGKINSQRAIKYDNEEAFINAAKYILSKNNRNSQVGIIGEFLFHCLMRITDSKIEFLSCCPTIGFSDSYRGFFKGFDGCYYSNNGIWIAEIKSKLKTNNLDKDNEAKLKIASKQLEKEVRDKEINRWENAKKYVSLQLTNEEFDDNNIYELLTKSNAILNYNKILGTMIICPNSDFDKEYIKKYASNLIDAEVENQTMIIK